MNITKEDIEKLIEVKKDDTLINHFLTIVKRDFRATGQIERNKIKIWSQGPWNSTFYPIFEFKLNSQNHLIDITDKLNPIGKIFYSGFLLGLISFFLTRNWSDFNLQEYLMPLVIGLIFITIFLLIINNIYRFEKKQQLKEIFEILDIELDATEPEREWTLTKIITRVFMYPICIFLIIVNIFILIPQGEIIPMIGSLGIVGTYLYTDLKILLKKKTTENTI